MNELFFNQPQHPVGRQMPRAWSQPLKKMPPNENQSLKEKARDFFHMAASQGSQRKSFAINRDPELCFRGTAKLFFFFSPSFSWGFPPNPHLPFGEGGLDERFSKYLCLVYYYQGEITWTPLHTA
jgi:hypothetical protein